MTMPNLSAIRAAILEAPETAQFGLGAFCDADALARMRSAPHLQGFLAQMRAEASRATAEPPAPLTFDLFRRFEVSGDRAAYEAVYFDRYRRFAGLLLTTLIDETDAYLPALSELIWMMCGEYTWALPAHLRVGVEAVQAERVPPEQVVDLFAAHVAHMLAEAVYLLGDRLDAWLIYRVRHEIERRVFQPVFYDPRHFWWESAAMNWASVCAGCVGMAALILVDDREALAGMIQRVVRTMDCFLEGFGADGGCPEGIVYWAYGFGFYTYFADMLGAFTAGKLDLLDNPHVRRIAAFPQAVSLGGGRYVNFSDASEEAEVFSGLGSYLAARFDEPMPSLKPPRLDADYIYRWGHVSRDLLWTDAAQLDLPACGGTHQLDTLGWMIARRALDGQTLAFAAKGGHNDEPHNHNDLGHFIIHVGGESLLADLGAGVYTRQYFTEGRYGFIHTGSHGHSVPVMNGFRQVAGAGHVAIVLSASHTGDTAHLSLDLTQAYPADAGLSRFIRTFDWAVGDGQQATLTLRDEVAFEVAESRFEACFVSLVKPEISAGMAVWRGEHGEVSMRFDAAAFDVAVVAEDTLTHHQRPITVYRLLLRARAAEAARTDTFVFRARVL